MKLNNKGEYNMKNIMKSANKTINGLADSNREYFDNLYRANTTYGMDDICILPIPMGTNPTWKDIVVGKGKYILVPETGNFILTCKELNEWTLVKLRVSDTWISISYSDGRFVLLGENHVATSSNGTTWKITKLYEKNDNCFKAINNKGDCIAISKNQKYVYNSRKIF